MTPIGYVGMLLQNSFSHQSHCDVSLLKFGVLNCHTGVGQRFRRIPTVQLVAARDRRHTHHVRVDVSDCVCQIQVESSCLASVQSYSNLCCALCLVYSWSNTDREWSLWHGRRRIHRNSAANWSIVDRAIIVVSRRFVKHGCIFGANV